MSTQRRRSEGYYVTRSLEQLPRYSERIRLWSNSGVDRLEQIATTCFERYTALVDTPPKSVHSRIMRFKELTEELITLARAQTVLIETLSQVCAELTGEQSFENSGKTWTEEEDEALINMKADGWPIIKITKTLGRSPASVATRTSYLVGIRRLFIAVDGRIVGSLDGYDIDGNFTGIVERV